MVLTLLMCPAVNRVVRVQRIDLSPIGYGPSFQRSLQIPPKRLVVLRDARVVFIVVAPPLDVRVARYLPPTDDLLPSPVPISSPPPLRAPPAAV